MGKELLDERQFAREVGPQRNNRLNFTAVAQC